MISRHKNSSFAKGCDNMTKFSTKIEMIVYRFILSLVIGFFLGSYLITNSDNSITRSLERVVCSGPASFRDLMQIRARHEPRRKTRLDVETGVLYVGMMSMSKYLDTRVAAAMDTWAHDQDVRLEIFASVETNDTRARITTLESGARIIQLPGVSDVSYPPQRKSFSMLKFIHDNYLKNFDWFLRMDDDAYVKVDQLRKLLSRADPNRPLLIGRAGHGKHAEDYLKPGENYCMGGTGIIFSRELLRQVGPKLAECLGEMYTEHEDVEMGRCVRKIAGVSCTEAWETTSLFYQNYGGKGSYEENIGEVTESKRAVAVTFHANKVSRYQYRLHQTLLKDKITKTLTKITKMETEIKKMKSLLKMSRFDDTAWNFHAGYVWESISQRSVYSATSQIVRGIPVSIKDAVVRNVYFTVQDLRMKYPALQNHIHEISVTHTMYHVNPLTSADMISRLKVRTTLNKKSTYVYLKNIFFRKTFTNHLAYFYEENAIDSKALREKLRIRGRKQSTDLGAYTDAPSRVNFVVALSGRPDNLVRFLKNYKEAFLANAENVSITVVYFPNVQSPVSTQKSNQIIDMDERNKLINASSKSDDIHFVSKLLEQVRIDYPGSEADFVQITNGASFSRGYGLQTGSKRFRNEELIFFCDVDLVFGPEMLYRIRRSTIRGKQVYYPTFFSQYDPEIVYSYHDPPGTHFYFEEIAGFWRTFSYGMVAIYKSDFLMTGGFDLSIRGWGLEDLRFCDAVMKKAKLDVFKTNEPAMVHVYHDKDCLPDLTRDQYTSCQKSRAQHFGPRTLLYYVWQQGSDIEDIENDPNVKVDSRLPDNTNVAG